MNIHINASSIHRNWNFADFDLYVTLSTDKQGFPVRLLKSNISKLFCMIERKMFGSRFHKKLSEQRIQFIGFPERINTSPHYHLLLRFPKDIKNESPNGRTSDFTTHLEKFWGKFVEPTMEIIGLNSLVKNREVIVKNDEMMLVKNRYCDVQEVYSQRVVDYVTKELFDPQNEEHIIFNNVPFK